MDRRLPRRLGRPARSLRRVRRGGADEPRPPLRAADRRPARAGLRRLHRPRGPARVLRDRTLPGGSSTRAATCASAASGRSRSARRATSSTTTATCSRRSSGRAGSCSRRPRRGSTARASRRRWSSRFEPRDGGTLMTMVHAGFPTEELRDEHTRGLPHAFDRFERTLDERRPMSNSVLYMSMSLDGFIAGPDDGPGQGLGAGGEVLHDWLGDRGRRPLRLRPRRAQRPGLRRADGDRSRAGRAPHVRHRRPLERRSPTASRSSSRPGASRRSRHRTWSTTSPTGSRARWRRRRRRRATPT